jgi:hypothetical protein
MLAAARTDVPEPPQPKLPAIYTIYIFTHGFAQLTGGLDVLIVNLEAL